MPSICSNIENFWHENYLFVSQEILRSPGLKIRFGGDIGPQKSDAVFERVGLYFDTLIVPDPMLRVASLPDDVNKTKDYYLLKYGIEQVLAKDIYLADVYPPIAVLVADSELAGNDRGFQGLSSLAQIDCVILTNELYNQKFDNFDEVQTFFSRFQDIQEAVGEVQKPDLFFWDEDAALLPSAQLEAILQRDNLDWDRKELSSKLQGPNYLPFMFMGRMMQINDIVHRSYYQGVHPLVVAPVSYHWLAWKLNANQQQLVSNGFGMQNVLELKLTNALLSDDLMWLSNVTISDLIELRRKGYLSELRSTIQKETDRFSNAKLDELEGIAPQVDYNLRAVLQQHQDEIEKLDKSFRSELALSGSTFLLSLAAAVQPSLSPLAPNWMTTIGSVIGTTSLHGVVKATIEYLRDRKSLGKSPIGILWKARNKSQKD
jgi:hypothetical protein